MSTRSSLAFSYAGYLVRYVYLLILIPFYGRVLGVSAYGRVLAAMSLYAVVWTVTSYGFSIVGAREVASTEDLGAQAAEFGRHLHARLLLSVIGAVIGGVATLSSPDLRADPLMGLAATGLGLAQAFNLGWYFQGLGRFPISVSLEVLGFVVSLVLILVLVDGPADAHWVLLSLLASTLLSTGLGYLIAWKTIDRARVLVRGGLALIRASTPVFLLGGVSILVVSASSYILSLFASSEEVGRFGSAERLAGIVMALMVPANQVLVSAVSKRVSLGSGGADSFRMMKTALVAMVSAGCVATALVIALAPYAVPLILGSQFDASVRLLQMLALSYPFFAFSQVINLYVLIPLRRDRLAMVITISSTVIQLLAFLFLVRSAGGTGAAGARLFGECLTAMLLGIAIWRTGLWKSLMGRPT